MTFLVVIIVLALIFDYINGFHDAANSIATIVSTKVLTPFQAVLWAAFFNFAAFFVSKYIIGEFKIGNTIAKSVTEDFINLEVIFAGLLAAISWNLLTWWFGIPSSSSHSHQPKRYSRNQLRQSSSNLRLYFSRATDRDDNSPSNHGLYSKYLSKGQPCPGRELVQTASAGVIGNVQSWPRW